MKIIPASLRQSPQANLLLAALPAAEFAALEPQLELVPMPLGWVLYESGASQRYAYFPTTAVVALQRFMADGFSAASAVAGNEGAVGIASFMGGDSTPDRAVVQGAGFAYRVESRALKREFDRSAGLRNLLLHYTQALITQMMQTVACNRLHSVEQQLCRFLLLHLDRISGEELDLTQELIGNLLGVRREGVTEAAGRIQAAGMIRYRRGHISVLDRAKLEAYACECYAVVKREYERLLPGVAWQAPKSSSWAAARAAGAALPALWARHPADAQ
jgi:CRP-like cAMP-binding protein